MPTDKRRIPRLAVDLIRGVVEIARSTGALFAFEAKQAARLVGVRLLTLAIALSLVVSGIVLVIAALATWLGTVLGETWMGFAVVGGGAVLVGAAVMAWAAMSLARQRGIRFPESRGQIGRDMEWLEQQLGKDETQSSDD